MWVKIHVSAFIVPARFWRVCAFGGTVAFAVLFFFRFMPFISSLSFAISYVRNDIIFYYTHINCTFAFSTSNIHFARFKTADQRQNEARIHLSIFCIFIYMRRTHIRLSIWHIHTIYGIIVPVLRFDRNVRFDSVTSSSFLFSLSSLFFLFFPFPFFVLAFLACVLFQQSYTYTDIHTYSEKHTMKT